MRPIQPLALLLLGLACGCGSQGAGASAGTDFELDPAALRELASLGYLGGGAEAPDASNADGGDDSKGPEKVETWKRAAATPNGSVLRVGDDDELPLTGMDANVWVEGHRARVVLDCFYLNDRGRQLEGEFRLRLPEGASPYFFAFGGTRFVDAPDDGAPTGPALFDRDQRAGLGHDPAAILSDRVALWEEPKEARVVPRDTAAHAYLDVVRQRVDPALMEWAGAGVFNASVFPLEPGREHRIVIGYELDLTPAGDDLEYRLDLPEDVPWLGVDLRVAVPGELGAMVSPANEPFEDGRYAHFLWANPEERSFLVRFPEAPVTALSSPSTVDEDWFALRFRPELPEVVDAGASRAVFLVDSSLSSARGTFPIWLDLMSAILAENRDDLRELAVLFFDVEARWWREGFVPNTPAQVDALLAHAGDLALEGATDVASALAEAARPSWAGGAPDGEAWDVFLLSDGAASWGLDDDHAIVAPLAGSHAGPVFAYATGLPGAARRTLDAITRATGGAVFTVSGAAEVPAAAVAHRKRPWRIEELRLGGARDLLLGGRPLSVFPGQSLRLAGRGRPGVGDAIELVLSQGGELRTFRTPIEEALESELAARAYGQTAVEQLEELGTWTADASRAFATHFRVPGETCSLLMLESEEDYQRYGIEPEQDATLVRSTEVRGLVDEALALIGDILGDPKVAFLGWLDRMAELPGVEWKPAKGLRAALEDLPRRAFEVPTERLVCRDRRAAGVPAEVGAEVGSFEPAYDVVVTEASRRLAERGAADALRVLSSLVELNPGSGLFRRDVAYSAAEHGLVGHAYHLFHRVAEARPFEPQTYRDLAECLARAGHTDHAIAWYEVAVGGRWPARFGDFRRIAIVDYASLLREVRRGARESALGVAWAERRLAELSEEVGLERADLLISISWNTDRSDVDLHVVEPTGEDCHYGNRETKIGGRITADVTQGFGPEMYVIEDAKRGDYRAFVHYFAQDALKTSVRTKVYATVFEAWGSEDERVSRRTVTLTAGVDQHDVAKLVVGR